MGKERAYSGSRHPQFKKHVDIALAHHPCMANDESMQTRQPERLRLATSCSCCSSLPAHEHEL